MSEMATVRRVVVEVVQVQLRRRKPCEQARVMLGGRLARWRLRGVERRKSSVALETCGSHAGYGSVRRLRQRERRRLGKSGIGRGWAVDVAEEGLAGGPGLRQAAVVAAVVVSCGGSQW